MAICGLGVGGYHTSKLFNILNKVGEMTLLKLRLRMAAVLFIPLGYFNGRDLMGIEW